MPADTLNEMVLGFSVIMGVLLIYILSLALRTRKARIPKEQAPRE